MSERPSRPEGGHAEPLAIVGMACLFPRADSLGAFWRNVRTGVDAIGDVPPDRWRPEDYFDPDPGAPDMTYTRRGGFLEPIEFNPLEFGISPNAVEATDTTQLLGMLVARDALRDAGYAPTASAEGRAFDRARASVILGVTGALELVVPLGARLGHPLWRRALREAGVDEDTTEDVVRRIGHAYVPWQEASFPGLLGNVAAGRIASRFDLGGTNCVVDAACASSLSALHLAALELHAGRSDMVITGGIDTFSDIFMYMCFSKTPALSPTGTSRPFSADGDGTILGEGLGVVVLKRLADARRDGDRVYALVRGVGAGSDGSGSAIYAPQARGQVRAMETAYRQAAVAPSTVGLIEAHGTGTRVGDATEIESVCTVLGEVRDSAASCAIGSVKSMIGHTKAAAGIAGLIKATLALHHKVLPPTLHVSRPHPALEREGTPVYVNTEARPWLPVGEAPRRAGVSAFGFGGANFHCVLEEHVASRSMPMWDGSVVPLALSAASRAELLAELDAVPADIDWATLRAEAARKRPRFDADAAHRLVIVLEHGADVPTRLSSARRLVESTEGDVATPEGTFCANLPRDGTVAALFPGQGSQYPGMLRDLACLFPEALESLACADRAFGEEQPGRRLSDFVFPPPAFDDAARDAAAERLRDTRIAQPAIGAVSLGAWHVLSHLGVAPDAAAGHSFGELTALAATGRLREADFHALAVARGHAMGALEGDHGGMLAVTAPVDAIQSLIEQEQLDLVVANRNAPDQVVVSGASAAIDRAARLLGARDVRARRLPVSAAFHSALVADARRPFAEALRAVTLAPARSAVYANSTAEPYPEDARAAGDLLAEQIASPVDFVQQIENMYEAGVRTFVEVGPGRVLTALIRSILGNRPHAASALDASGGKRAGAFDLACLLARLATLGHSVRLDRWDPEPPAPREPAPPGLGIPLTGANWTRPREPLAPSHRTPRRGAEEPATPDPGTRSASRAAEPSGTFPAPCEPTASAGAAPRSVLSALERMQEQTADLHRRYLEGQAEMQRALAALLDGGIEAATASVPAPDPAVHAPSPPPAGESAAPAAPAPEPRTGTTSSSGAPASEPPAPAGDAPSAGSARGAAVAADTPGGDVLAIVCQVVAEKTGYPASSLAAAMALDSDLGIDSIKRVEILSALQDRLPDAPAVEPDRLAGLHTLADVAACLGAPASEPPAPAGDAPSAGSVRGAAVAADTPGGDVLAIVCQVVAEKTGYPASSLAAAMALDSDLGIDSIKRVEILSALQDRLPDAPAVEPDRLAGLHTLADVAACLDAPASERSEPSADDPTAGPGQDIERLALRAVALRGERRASPIAGDGEVWVSDDGGGLATAVAESLAAHGARARVVPVGTTTGEPSPRGLILLAPRDADRNFVRNAFALVRACGPGLRARHGFLAAVCRLDGAFGLDGGPVVAPATAGVAGIAKCAALEWPEVSCRSIDIGGDVPSVVATAELLADELTREGPSEVGFSHEGIVGLEAAPSTLEPTGERAPVAPGELVVVSGGGRGVTAAAAIAMAEAWRPTLLVLGRSEPPGPEPDWLADLATEAEVKAALAERIGRDDPSPRALETAWRRVTAAREMRAAFDAIGAAGSEVVYRAVDVRDAETVGRVIDAVRARHGPVRGIVHGAGVLADRLISDKTEEQFDSVYHTKVDGLRALLAAAGEDELRFLSVFSSSSARFGRRGQADYAAANEVLNKMAQDEARRRPGCRVVSLNWGPWEGGMVTPGLASLFRSEGLDLIPLRRGAEHHLRELTAGAGAPVEIVVLARTHAGAGAVHRLSTSER